VIVSLHVATGAAGGALAGTRRRALLLGPALHLAGDLVPHWDLKSRRFELRSGLGGLALLALTRGPLDPATLGAAAAAAPDLEHVLPLPRPGGRKLFPSHRLHGWHRPGGLRTRTQILAAGLLLGLVVSSPRRR
jgi:hypothetical protein